MYVYTHIYIYIYICLFFPFYLHIHELRPRYAPQRPDEEVDIQYMGGQGNQVALQQQGEHTHKMFQMAAEYMSGQANQLTTTFQNCITQMNNQHATNLAQMQQQQAQQQTQMLASISAQQTQTVEALTALVTAVVAKPKAPANQGPSRHALGSRPLGARHVPAKAPAAPWAAPKTAPAAIGARAPPIGADPQRPPAQAPWPPARARWPPLLGPTAGKSSSSTTEDCSGPQAGLSWACQQLTRPTPKWQQTGEEAAAALAQLRMHLGGPKQPTHPPAKRGASWIEQAAAAAAAAAPAHPAKSWMDRAQDANTAHLRPPGMPPMMPPQMVPPRNDAPGGPAGPQAAGENPAPLLPLAGQPKEGAVPPQPPAAEPKHAAAGRAAAAAEGRAAAAEPPPGQPEPAAEPPPAGPAAEAPPGPAAAESPEEGHPPPGEGKGEGKGKQLGPQDRLYIYIYRCISGISNIKLRQM
jgi:hypothetical protein